MTSSFPCPYPVINPGRVGVDSFNTLISGGVRAKGTECVVTRNVAHFERIPDLRVEEH